VTEKHRRLTPGIRQGTPRSTALHVHWWQVQRVRRVRPGISIADARREAARNRREWQGDHSEAIAENFREDEGRTPSRTEIRERIRRVWRILAITPEETTTEERTWAVRAVRVRGSACDGSY
jgi:hypothetical protein